jgi:hypothetical protein
MPSGTIFYAVLGDSSVPAENGPTFYQSTGTLLSVLTNYIARVGRQNLKFQYRHNAPNNRRIDPSPNNLNRFLHFDQVIFK